MSSPEVIRCSEVYYPRWSSRGIRGVKCERPAKLEGRINPYAAIAVWRPKCGIHARMYETRPLHGDLIRG